MDRIIREGFYTGGTDLHIYKLIGNHNQYENVAFASNPDLDIFATNEYAAHRRGEKAFDGNPESYYKNTNPGAALGSEYIQVDFGAGDPAECTGVIINGWGYKQHGLHTSPTEIEVWGSQNAVSWESFGSFSISDSEEIQRFEFENITKYRYYRFLNGGPIYGVYDGTDPSATWEVAIMELYSEAGRFGVQDPLFMETRDRKYDAESSNILCHYEIPEKPHDLSKFGFIVPSDQLEITILRSDIELLLGRMIGIGDIVTLPHITDDSYDDGGLPNHLDGKRYEVVDVSIAAAGYDPRWRDHLQRVVVAPLKDKPEVYDILGYPNDCPPPGCGDSRNSFLDLNDRMEWEAANAGEHGQDLSEIAHGPDITLATGPMTQDSYPPNNEPWTDGLDFPTSAVDGDWFRHIGYDTPRLYKYSGNRWIRKEIESREHFDGRDTMRGILKDNLSLPLTGSSIQQSLKDE